MARKSDEPSLEDIMENAGLSARTKEKLRESRDKLIKASSEPAAKSEGRPRGSGAAQEVMRSPHGL